MIQLVQLQDSQRVLDLQLKLTSRADHYGLRRTQCSPQDFLKGYWGLHNHIFLGYIIIMSQEPVMQKTARNVSPYSSSHWRLLRVPAVLFT